MKIWILLLIAILVLLSPAVSGCGEKEYSLSITVSGQGTTAPSPGTYTYDKGEDVTMTATPASDWKFDQWGGDASGTSVTITLHMDGNKAITANFSKITYTLTMAVNGTGTTDPAVGAHSYDAGTVVDITATASSGWQFVNWGGNVAAPLSPTTTVSMNSDKTVTANFSKITYTLTLAVDGTGTTDPAVGTHSYDPGTVVSIAATASTNWQFVNWSGDVVAPLSPTTTVSMNSDKTVTANFAGVWTGVWTGNEVVHTAYGAVSGFEDEANTWVWKAIPYAKPPVGELRWKAPQNPDSWAGIREETEFCSPCSQYSAPDASSVVGSEDCLYLNIWRPQSQETNLPVYVWIHGGGNSIGSAALVPTYYGANLANRSDMVFVSVNYRLGPLGWFTYPALRSGQPGREADDSGNYGILDLIQALKWIQGNIVAFGGDPDKVTITGESAGAVNVLSLIISPLAKDLFQRAVVQSGVAVSTTVAQGEASAHDVLLKLLVKDHEAGNLEEAESYLSGMSDAQIAAYLRSKTAEELLAGHEKMDFGMISFPFNFEDGTVIPAAGFDTLETGIYPNKVPIIIGSNKEEVKIFLFMDPFFLGKDELYEVIASYGSDLWKASYVDALARELESHADQPDVYVYQFCWGAAGDTRESPIPDPWGFKLGACHSLDVPFFLGNDNFNGPMTSLVFTEENRLGREALSDVMMSYVAQFARTGDPNAPGTGLPEWEPWSNGMDEPRCILFDADGDEADIKMSTQELTQSGVLAAMQSEIPQPLYSEAIDFMSSSPLLSYLLATGSEGQATALQPSLVQGGSDQDGQNARWGMPDFTLGKEMALF